MGRPEVAAQVLVHAGRRDISLRVETFPPCGHVEAGESDLWEERRWLEKLRRKREDSRRVGVSLRRGSCTW